MYDDMESYLLAKKYAEKLAEETRQAALEVAQQAAKDATPTITKIKTPIIPVMTANNAPSPFVASCSSVYSSDYSAWNAFKNAPDSYGWLGYGTSGWLQIDLGAQYSPIAYSVSCRIEQKTIDDVARTWTLQGSNDGNTFTVIDTQSNQVFAAAETKTYNLPYNSYRYYKLVITANNGDVYTSIGNFQLYKGSVENGIIVADSNKNLVVSNIPVGDAVKIQGKAVPMPTQEDDKKALVYDHPSNAYKLSPITELVENILDNTTFIDTLAEDELRIGVNYAGAPAAIIAAAESLDYADGYTEISNRMIYQDKNNKTYYLIQSWLGYENFGATVEFADRGSHTFFMRTWNGNAWGAETRYDDKVSMSTSVYNFLWSKNDVINGTGGKLLSAGINGTETVKQELVRRIGALETIDASNPNLLINEDLANGVWQRGTSFTISSGKWYYTADRYRCKTASGSATVTKDTTGLKTSAALTIQQVLEDADFAKINGKTVTLSYSKNGVITVSTFVASSAVVFNIDLAANDVLNWAKLELGSYATSLIARPYAQEELLCRRYYQKIRFFGTANSSVNLVMPTSFSIPMRTAPSVLASRYADGTKMNTMDYFGTGEISLMGTLSWNGLDNMSVYWLITSSSSFIAGGQYGGYLYLDAEIYN